MNSKLYSALFAAFLFNITLPQQTFAQWVKQSLPATIGTPHMTYPGLNKNAIGKNFLMMFTYNFDGNSSQVGSVEAVRTTDGGRTYRTSTLPINMSGYHRAPYLLDAKTAFLATTHIETNATAIYRTVDSGATWQVLPYHPQSFLNAVVFFDQNNGIAICDRDSVGAFIAYTTNGGISFTRLPQTNVPNARPEEVILGGGEQVIGNAIIQPTLDLETGLFRMWRSTDRGRNWAAGEWMEETSPFGPNTIFTDANNGLWIQGEVTPENHAFYTTDGGHTWQESGALPGLISGGPMSYLPKTNNIVGVFEDAARLMIFTAITNDYGKTWNSKKDVAPYKPDTIYVDLYGVPPFAWTNLDIVDNNTAWAKLSRTELYHYNSSTPLVPEKPDLDLELTADNNGLPLWGSVKFTLTIKNRGISKATDIKVNWLPPYKRTNNGAGAFAYQAAYSSKGQYDSWNGVWSINELQAGETQTATFHLFVVDKSRNVTQTAQIVAENEQDLDSQPNNMTITAKEDDEVTFISVAPITNFAEPESHNQSSFGFKAFPNPTNDNVTVYYKLDGADYVTFTLSDINGRILYEKTTPSVKTGSEMVSLQDLPKGIYLLKMARTNESKTEKIIKE